MYTSKILEDIKLEAGLDVQKEITLLELEIGEQCENIDIYTRLSQLYTAERNYKRSTEIISLAIDKLNQNHFS